MSQVETSTAREVRRGVVSTPWSGHTPSFAPGPLAQPMGGRKAWLAVGCIVLALATFVFPAARSFLRVEVGYNEGWNIYNADLVAHHGLLYGARPAWTTVNYPMLSFVWMAWLHRLTHEYLLTARIVSLLSLLLCCGLVHAIVRRLGAPRLAAVLAGFYTLAVFCTDADAYVGMDDPQMLAQVFFLGGLLVYLQDRGAGDDAEARGSRLLRRRVLDPEPSFFAIASAALLFVVGGSIKHNPIDFPLAVLIDLALLSWRRAVWFAVSGACFAAIACALNVHFGGHFFLAQLLAPRSYSTAKAWDDLVNVFGPLLLPFCVAGFMAWRVRADKSRRIAAILFVVSLVVGGYFGGGVGVSINALFSAVFATAILVGLFWRQLAVASSRRQTRWEGRLERYAPAVLFLWLLIPWLLVAFLITGEWSPVARYEKAAAGEARFARQVALLRAQPGPVLCESLLRCYAAGKPYVYDPFNATRLIAFGRLDPAPMLEGLRQHRFAAVQFDDPMAIERHSERWDPAFVQAIEANYQPALADEDGEIYLPKTN